MRNPTQDLQTASQDLLLLTGLCKAGIQCAGNEGENEAIAALFRTIEDKCFGLYEVLRDNNSLYPDQ
ncbi:MAG: hypothetical protein AAGG51_21165 [Cyanobacteria bacterium P01_G01_bin.54]